MPAGWNASATNDHRTTAEAADHTAECPGQPGARQYPRGPGVRHYDCVGAVTSNEP